MEFLEKPFLNTVKIKNTQDYRSNLIRVWFKQDCLFLHDNEKSEVSNDFLFRKKLSTCNFSGFMAFTCSRLTGNEYKQSLHIVHITIHMLSEAIYTPTCILSCLSVWGICAPSCMRIREFFHHLPYRASIL